ncbi:DUF6607 family protein [Gilvimarinus sp. F26214L]|uniref:DUF6607 family protein n=1 Tax=Gilvimarinus sp. DZF01 TaxID=3461371 RepID=UPI0040467393
MNFLVRSSVGRVMVLLLLTFSGPLLAAKESAEDARCDRHQPLFVFSWQLTDPCAMSPRGGTSAGAPLTLDPDPSPGWLSLQEEGLSNFERDRRAILAMAGPYQTTFDFIEVYGLTPEFEPDPPYQSWGTEYVYVVEDRGDFISLQHIMVMVYEDESGKISEPVVMKHWRQDWAYEKRDILVYAGEGKFEHRKYSRRDVKGHWAQAVYQVDDSPRYEAIGQWEHRPNFSTWLSDETWRPLPRRESSVRDDYDVLVGTNRHTIVPRGWIQEEANYKTVLERAGEPGGDQPYLSKELGVNRYLRVKDFDFGPGDRYWERTQAFWDDVRDVWSEIIADNKDFMLKKTVDGVPLFSPFFSYAEDVYKSESYDAEEGRAFIESTLDNYVER